MYVPQTSCSQLEWFAFNLIYNTICINVFVSFRALFNDSFRVEAILCRIVG